MKFTDAQKDAAENQIVEQSKRIEFYLTDFSIELLATKMKDHEFEIPDYQREFTWENSRKSRFLESLLIGLPIPFLFFWESPSSGKLEIVDGSQRLRTIEQFIFGGLPLGELETLTELSGMKFSDLSIPRQRKIKNRSIRGIVLNEHADEQARFEIFDRINTGSKLAKKAEIRRGALTGPFLDLVISLADQEDFKKLALIPEKSVQLREREELITRFFAYGDGLEGYHDRPSDFLFQYAKRMNDYFTMHPPMVREYRERFVNTMKFVAKVFPFGFRRNIRGIATPRTRFEAIAIGSDLALRENPEIAPQEHHVTEWLTGRSFKAPR
jgi:hypothetical protein